MKINLKNIDFNKKVSWRATVFVLILLIVAVVCAYDYLENGKLPFQTASVVETGVDTDTTGTDAIATKDCNYKKISLTGMLLTYYDGDEGDYVYSDWLVGEIEKAEKDEKIKAIVVEIDSGGGYPVAGEEILKALKNSEKKTIALIRQSGMSAAYMAALGADVIFASKFSDVGSIGVTVSYADATNKNKSEGIIFNQLSSGKYKDMMNPDKPLTQEEKALIMRDIKIIHEDFIKIVAESRKLSIEKVRQMADGSSMLGEMALKSGLIDKIGSINEVRDYLKTELNIEPKECVEEDWEY